MQIVINIDEKEYKQIIKGNWIGEAMAEIFENGTVLPDNPTNGDMIKALFPNIKMWGESKDTLDYSLGGMIHRVLKSWWNAPYEW